jgi:hypothetical protein
MSRGPGRKQTTVLDHLKGSPEPVSFESLRWTLWAREPGSSGGDLPNAWNTSVFRAVQALAEDGKLHTDRRRLVSFEEAVVNYPHKTLQGATRRLRLELLPVLQKGIQDGEAFARYNPADNEKFHLGSLTPEGHRSLQRTWLRLEPQLIDLLPELDRADRNALFCLLARGKSIFETQDLTVRHSFAEHHRICAERQSLPEPLEGQVKTFADALVPPADAGHLRLKGFVHSFAHVPRHRGCTLKEDTVEYLARMCPDLVRSLPEYVPGSAPEVGHVRYTLMGVYCKEKHSPQLYKLLDQSIFQEFNFLSFP